MAMEEENKPNSVSQTCENSENSNEFVTEPGLSKRQKRKLEKHQKWLEYKPIKRAKEKEKKKLRRQNRDPSVPLPPSRKQLKNSSMSSSKCHLRIVLDFSFDHLMIPKDINKCLKQLSRCYSINRRLENPLQFYVTSFEGVSKTEMEKNIGYLNWDVNFKSEHYLNLFKKEDIVYLTSESDNVLNELDDSKAYIIGALVDHNSQKGLCLSIAQEQGISHGRLPIKENLEMSTRQVLTIDQVFEIMSRVANGTSWEESLLKTIPPRKGASIKSKESAESGSPKPPDENQSSNPSSQPIDDNEPS